MKKCKAIKKNGSECDANGIHIAPVIGKGDVVYATVLPPDHVDSTWSTSSINVCGAHRKMLLDGAAINVAPVIAPTYGCACKGTGVDPDFGDLCKCSSAMSPSPSQDLIRPVAPGQEKYISNQMEIRASGTKFVVFTAQKLNDGRIIPLDVLQLRPENAALPFSSLLRKLHEANKVPTSTRFMWVCDGNAPIKVFIRSGSGKSWTAYDKKVLPSFVSY